MGGIESEEEVFKGDFMTSTGPVWISLFDLIYWHNHLCDCLEELMKTTYDLFVSFLHFMILGKDRKELVVGEKGEDEIMGLKVEKGNHYNCTWVVWQG